MQFARYQVVNKNGLFAAIRTDSVNEITGRSCRISFRDFYGRHGDAVKAVCLVAAGAVEMHVKVVVVLPGGMAEFITDAVTGIFQHMYKMGVTEEGERTENAAFIHRLKPSFQFHKGQRATGR